MQPAANPNRHSRFHRMRMCARISMLIRAITTPSGFSPLPTRGRKRGEGQPAPFPAPTLNSVPDDLPSACWLETVDRKAMQEIEGTGTGLRGTPP